MMWWVRCIRVICLGVIDEIFSNGSFTLNPEGSITMQKIYDYLS